MPVLWQGHEVDAYRITSANNIEETDARDFDYERTGMKVSRNANVSSLANGELRSRPDFGAQNLIWHRFKRIDYRNTALTVIWAAEKADGTVAAQIVAISATFAKLQLLLGGVLTDVGAPFAIYPEGTITRFDVHLNAVVGGAAQIWYGPPSAQLKVLDTAGDYSGAGAIVRIMHGGNWGNPFGASHVAHEIVQTASTLSSTSEIKPPTADGTDVDGTGTFADVDEQVFNDVDTVVLPAVGNRHSFTSPARLHTQDIVSGVTVSCRAWYEPGGPTSIKPYLKIGGVRYYGDTFALDVVPLAYQYTWLTNPATAVAFTTAQGNDATLEYGWEAAA